MVVLRSGRKCCEDIDSMISECEKSIGNHKDINNGNNENEINLMKKLRGINMANTKCITNNNQTSTKSCHEQNYGDSNDGKDDKATETKKRMVTEQSDIQNDDFKKSINQSLTSNTCKQNDHQYDPNWKSKLLLNLVKELQSQADPERLFYKSVDPIEDGIPDYFDIVKKEDAMSFETMQSLVKEKKLVDLDDVEKCLKRIVKCANLYYGGCDNYIVKQANLIMSLSESHLHQAREMWRSMEEIECSHGAARNEKDKEDDGGKQTSLNDDVVEDATIMTRKNIGALEINDDNANYVEIDLPKGAVGITLTLVPYKRSKIGAQIVSVKNNSAVRHLINPGDVIVSYMGDTIKSRKTKEFTGLFNSMKNEVRRIGLMKSSLSKEIGNPKVKNTNNIDHATSHYLSSTGSQRYSQRMRRSIRIKMSSSHGGDCRPKQNGVHSSKHNDVVSASNEVLIPVDKVFEKLDDATSQLSSSEIRARRSSRNKASSSIGGDCRPKQNGVHSSKHNDVASASNEVLIPVDKVFEKLDDATSNLSSSEIRARRCSTNNGDYGNLGLNHEQSHDTRSQRFLYELIEQIRNKADEYRLFTNIVDLNDYPDYYSVIDKVNEDMNFTMMLELVSKNKITNVEDIEMNIEKIIMCAEKYFKDKENSFERRMARKIKARSSALIKRAKRKWVAIQKETNFEERIQIIKSMNSQGNKDFSDVIRKSEEEKPPSKRRRLKSRHCKRKGYYKESDSDDNILDHNIAGSKCQEEDVNDWGYLESSQIPFCDRDMSTSVIKQLTDRNEWKASIPKLVMVCNEAARRATLRSNTSALRFEKPLSESFIEERIEYDNPVNGFVVESKEESKEIQGFIKICNFVTFRKTLRWTSDDPAALITPTDHRVHATDKDFKLAMELQNLKRCGDPYCGYTIDRVCEISLLGGLGCGGFLLKKSIEELRKSAEYDYIVLQATKMSISFYEKHGFVRIGAVSRLGDNEATPEVAYRHWSEIVDGEAIDPSYMMAQKIYNVENSNSEHEHLIPTENRREREIKSALKSTYLLLSDALSIKVGKSNVHVNSYREMLFAAKDFAVSAGDDELVITINKALEECKDALTAFSKSLIRTKLKAPKKKSQLCQPDKELDSDTKVRVIFNSEVMNPEAALTAALVRSFLRIDPFYKVHVSIKSDEKLEQNLIASLRVSSSRSHTNYDMVDAMHLAVGNLKSFCYVPSQILSSRSKSQQIVKKGQMVMIKVQGFRNLPLWVEGEVLKCFKKKKFGKENLYLVSWFDGIKEKFMKTKRFLDNSNRGVGREWCTDLDYSSFALLPTKVLDSFFFGRQVKFIDFNGKVIEGTITKRLGGGLNNDPRWRLSTWLKGGNIPDYNALELREIMNFSDCVYKRVASVLRDIYPITRRSVNQKQDKKFIDQSEEWSTFRFNEFNLLKKEPALTQTQKKEVEFDERMIHLSTGVHDPRTKFALKRIRTQKKALECDETRIHSSTGGHETAANCVFKRRSKRLKCQITESPFMANDEMIKQLSFPKNAVQNSKVFDYVELQPFVRVVNIHQPQIT